MSVNQSMLRSIERSLFNPDTARCLQGAVLVLQQVAQNQLGNTLVPGHQAHGYAAEVLRRPANNNKNNNNNNNPVRSNTSPIRTSVDGEVDVKQQNATSTLAESANATTVQSPAPSPLAQQPPPHQPAPPHQSAPELQQQQQQQQEQQQQKQQQQHQPQQQQQESKDVSVSPGSRRHLMREANIPSSSFARVFGFGTLAVGLVGGALNESLRRAVGTSDQNTEPTSSSNDDQPSSEGTKMERPSAWMSQSNAVRLASSLSRMRGAALKLGQMLSIQDNEMVPPVLRDALARVRDGADYMPMKQLEKVLREDFGENWREKYFESFEDVPIAAASLGQVHRATLLDGTHVAVKVQYPGVAKSIQSDVRNLRLLSKATGIFPRGMFIERILDTMQEELKMECDYKREASNQQRVRALLSHLSNDFYIPKVFPDMSTDRVITMEYVSGQPIDDVQFLPQEIRDDVGRRLLKLTLMELFDFRFMQADPNFSNFLYDKQKDRIVLLDFGACTEFSEAFVDDYIELVWAASNMDRSALYDVSLRLNMLNGDESEEMVQAHIEAGLAVGAPFVREGPYDFGKSGVPKQTAKHGKTFLKDRLVPPPKEVYPLHRKLSGSYMTCIRIGATFPCRDLLKDSYERYHQRKAVRKSNNNPSEQATE